MKIKYLLGFAVLLACGCRKPHHVEEQNPTAVETQVLTLEMVVKSAKSDASGMYMIHALREGSWGSSDSRCPSGWKFKKDAFTLWVPDEHRVDGCYVLRNIDPRKPLAIHYDYLGPKESLGVDIPRIDEQSEDQQ